MRRAREQVRSFFERPDDVMATLDLLLDLDADPASALFGAVDPDRVGMTGHSFGGMTTYRVASLDPRIRVSMPLAPAVSPVVSDLPQPVPTMIQGALLDGTTPWETQQVAPYQRLLPPRFLVGIEDADHLVFADLCAGAAAGCNPAGTPPGTGHRLAIRYARAFLGVYLARDRRWQTLLEPTPGVFFAADP